MANDQTAPSLEAVERALKMQAGSVLARQALHLRSMLAERTAAVGDAANRYMAERARVAAVRALLDAARRADFPGTELNDRIRAVLDGPTEAPAPEPVDDHIAAWIKAARDHAVEHESDWRVLDDLLDDYRLHRVTGTPLDRHACEGSYCCADGQDYR